MGRGFNPCCMGTMAPIGKDGCYEGASISGNLGYLAGQEQCGVQWDSMHSYNNDGANLWDCIGTTHHGREIEGNT